MRAALTLLTLAGLCAGVEPKTLDVETFTLDWKDAKRKDREVPVRVYAPKGVKGPMPVILFSHGLGGSRDGYEYLGRHWAANGYVVVHLQHRGSDELVWKGKATPLAAMREAANAANAVARSYDVRFSVDRLAKLNKDEGRLKSLLDMDRLGMAGHSFGAQTTLAAAGTVYAGGKIDEPRIKAAVAMSPAPPALGDLGRAFGSITIPVFHLTGTKDDGAGITKLEPADRRKPFDHSKGPRWLLTLTDGDHAVFGGRKRLLAVKTDAAHHAAILSSTTAFLDHHLKGHARASAWTSDEFRKGLAKHGTFEEGKPAGKP